MKQTKKPRRWRWVACEKATPGDLVYIFRSERVPTKDDHGCWNWSGFDVVIVCRKEFEKTTGVKIRPGTCVKVELSGKVVK